jgi:formate dehydrogenase major subunit
VPTEKGWNLLQMMDAAERGELKALWAIGYDILLTNANAAATRRALGSLDLVIVQDMFLNETAKTFGTVFLPAASSFEKDGTFMNCERRVQRVRTVIDPRGEAKSDWEIICALAAALGKGDSFEYLSAQDIWDEVRRVWKAGSGVSYRRIEQAGLQWPCPAEDHPGTGILHGESFPVGQRAALRRIPFEPSKEQTSDSFPYVLTTGRTLYQFNAGTMTLRTPNIQLHAADFLDTSPMDAARLDVKDGDKVNIRSAYGEAQLVIRINNAMKPGELFATFHTPDAFVNSVTSPYRDANTLTPEYKVTAVSLEKALKNTSG